MADTGKQSPLGINVYGSLLQNIGFWINPTAASYMGKNKLTDPPVGDSTDYQFGKICENTCLKWLTWSIHDGFQRGAPRYPKGLDTEGKPLYPDKALADQIFAPPGFYTLYTTTYNNLVTIGQSRIPALGNSPPATWETTDPSGVWVNTNPEYYSLNQAGSPATSGYPYWSWYDPVAEVGGDIPNVTYRRDRSYVTEGQQASWYPFLCSVDNNTKAVPNRAITMWGWVRCIALQAWQDYNFGNEFRTVDPPEYRFFCDSFSGFYGFLKYTNDGLYPTEEAKTFLKGTYSNQDDLISADTAGVSLASRSFGQDLINLGNAIDFQYIKTFGLPSNVLKILYQNKALTSSVILSLLSAGLSQIDINSIGSGNTVATKEQEQKIYGAMLAILGTDLEEVLVILNCKTKGLTSLADLVNVKKMFPLSYTTLTVPIYNTSPGPTNSKTYYLLFVKQELNPQLVSPKIKEIVSTIVPAQAPPIVPEPTPVPAPPPAPKRSEPEIIVPPATPSTPAPNPIPSQTTPQTGGGGGCVALESFIPMVETEQKHNGREITKAWMLESGMKISLGTDDLEIIDGQVVKTLNDYQPCVRIITSDGITLICSTTAPILTRDKGFIPATEVYGKRVAVMRNGRAWFDEVVGLEDVGMKFVRVIDTGNNSFWAGERPGSFILHHNVAINDQNQMEKK